MPAFVLCTLVFALDRVSKDAVLERFVLGESKEVIPGFFNLTLIQNTGAAWGILRGQGLWLTLLAFTALFFLLVMRRHFTYVGILPRIALGLLLGGITGNLSDRLIYGSVVDFLDFYIGTLRWPAFNVADSSICIGVGLYLIHSLQSAHQFKKNN